MSFSAIVRRQWAKFFVAFDAAMTADLNDAPPGAFRFPGNLRQRLTSLSYFAGNAASRSPSVPSSELMFKMFSTVTQTTRTIARLFHPQFSEDAPPHLFHVPPAVWYFPSPFIRRSHGHRRLFRSNVVMFFTEKESHHSKRSRNDNEWIGLRPPFSLQRAMKVNKGLLADCDYWNINTKSTIWCDRSTLFNWPVCKNFNLHNGLSVSDAYIKSARTCVRPCTGVTLLQIETQCAFKYIRQVS